MSTGSADGERPRFARTPDLEERIIDVAGDPGISRKKSATAFSGGHMPYWKGLHEQLLFSFNLEYKRV